MSKSYKDNAPISRQKFMEELRRWQKGSVTRRHFLGVTGLGVATGVMATAMPGLRPARSVGAGEHRRPREPRHLAELPRPGEFRRLH